VYVMGKGAWLISPVLFLVGEHGVKRVHGVQGVFLVVLPLAVCAAGAGPSVLSFQCRTQHNDASISVVCVCVCVCVPPRFTSMAASRLFRARVRSKLVQLRESLTQVRCGRADKRAPHTRQSFVKSAHVMQ
jgi:hypothetical protein